MGKIFFNICRLMAEKKPKLTKLNAWIPYPGVRVRVRVPSPYFKSWFLPYPSPYPYLDSRRYFCPYPYHTLISKISPYPYPYPYPFFWNIPYPVLEALNFIPYPYPYSVPVPRTCTRREFSKVQSVQNKRINEVLQNRKLTKQLKNTHPKL